jgi:hypothetical protein
MGGLPVALRIYFPAKKDFRHYCPGHRPCQQGIPIIGIGF